LADTAEVTVTAPPSLVSLTISPGSVGLGAGQTQQFTVSGTYSNGSTGTPTVTWSATGGTINSSGLYTAGQFGGAFLVIASCGCGVEDTAEIALAASAPPTLQAIELTPSSVTLAPGDSQTFQATGRMSDGSTTTVAVSFTAGGGTMSGSIYTAGTAAGQYLVIARQSDGTLTDTSAVAIQSTVNSGYPNEPNGATLISERGFNAILEDGWGWTTDPDLSIQADVGAPRSASSTGMALFRAGHPGGSAPINTWRGLGSQFSTLYVSFWFKLSPNWYGHSSGVNKIFHIWIAGGNRVYLSAQGSSNNRLQSQVRLQGMGVGTVSFNLLPNQRDVEIRRGEWHRWELVLQANTPGIGDGTAEWWIDGMLAGRHTGMGFVSSSESNKWQTINWNPTWGGVDGTVPADQTMQFDHVRLSGKP
jgi:hypothetical protein